MSSSKDNNQIWRRVIVIAITCVCFAYGIVAIHTGKAFTRHGLPGHQEIYASERPGAFWYSVGLSFLVGGVLIYSGIAGLGASKPPRRGTKAERKEALRLGMTVSDVERDLPEFSRRNRSCQLVRGSCTKYSLPRHGSGTHVPWSLLQRTAHEGAQLANGYLLQGNVPDSLRQVLTKLATEFSEDYFEFEGTASDVAVYWEEWGGASEARHMHQILESLAGL